MVVKRDNKSDYSESYFVSSRGTSKIKKLNFNGNLVLEFSSKDSTLAAALSPTDMTYDASGNIIVCYPGHSIKKFDKDGKFLGNLVRYNSTLGIEGNFQSVAVDSQGYVYSLDNDCEVVIFNPAGGLISKFKLNGKSIPCLNTYEKIAVSKNGEYIYVTDKMNYRVQVFKRKN